jgi:hypothetical protein
VNQVEGLRIRDSAGYRCFQNRESGKVEEFQEVVMFECSSVGEHPLDTGKVVGSIPITRTIFRRLRKNLGSSSTLGANIASTKQVYTDSKKFYSAVTRANIEFKNRGAACRGFNALT